MRPHVRITVRRGSVSPLCPALGLSKNPAVSTTVLIVDDHAGFRVSARRTLEAEGFEVVGEAQDGESALRAARELRPELVLLDVQLPDLDGFEVAQRLTAGPDAPVVVLTSSRDPSDFAGLVSGCGARGFVPKSELSADALCMLLG
jgi:DNA-binding NarL/FixJ family response regulator